MKLKLAREIAACTKPRFVERPREKRSVVPFTEEELTEAVLLPRNIGGS